jgi:hypothetical protein
VRCDDKNMVAAATQGVALAMWPSAASDCKTLLCVRAKCGVDDLFKTWLSSELGVRRLQEPWLHIDVALA